MNKPTDWDSIVLYDPEEQRAYLKKQLTKYVETITKRDPKWKQFYLCVFDECKSREHTHSTGGAFSVYGKGKTKWKCQSCKHGGDIFDLIGYMNGIKSGKEDKQTLTDEFKQEYNKALEIFHLEPDFIPPDNEAKKDPEQPSTATKTEEFSGVVVHTVDNTTPAPDLGEQDTTPATEGQFKDYLEGCISACTEGSKGYNYLISRGFTPETIKRCLLGYNEEKNTITIPYDSSSYSYYTSRYIGEPAEGQGKYYKPKGLAAPVYNEGALFNKNEYCFVCEGPLDAISIIQAGSAAIALGGAGNQGKLISILKERKPAHCLILCFDFDGDEAGENGQRGLAEKLDDLNIPYVEAAFSLDKYEKPRHDPNELLISNPAQLREDVAANISKAKKYELEYELETGSVLHSVGDYADLFKKHQTAEKHRISTGFSGLDIALYGGFSNELYILSADTSTGKSAISCCLAQNIARQGIDVLYYCLEMGRDEFIARGASMISREVNKAPISYAEILNYKWDSRAQEFYRRDYREYEPYVNEYVQRYGEHLYYIERGNGKTAPEIAEAAEQFKLEHNIKQLVIVVDYLQQLDGDPNDKSQRDLMSITSGAVKTLASLATQKHNTVIAISSISNAQRGQNITESAGKYSGDIAFSGGVLLGWNWDGYTNAKGEDKEKTIKECKERGYRKMILEVLKQRSGERNNKQIFQYFPAYNYFLETDETGRPVSNVVSIKSGKGAKK